MSILGFLNNYKPISAFFAAYDIGLFDMLYENEASTDTIAQQLEIDKAMCRLLLYELREAHWIEEKNGIWNLCESFHNEYKNIDRYKAQIEHEMNIYNRLMSPNMIVRSLKCGYGMRPFDETGFDKKEQEIYDWAMYGENVKLIALQLSRLLRGIKGIRAIEIGRSNGVILNRLKELGIKLERYAVINGTVSFSDKYNVAIMFNTIHYWDEAYLQEQVEQWKKCLTNDAKIIIVDFFYEEGDEFVSNIMIDWITHGGVYWCISDELTNMMESSGYTKTKNIPLKSIHTTILQYQSDSEIQ